MIFSKPTKLGAGITIYGDQHDLSALHETIHRLAEREPLLGFIDEFVLGLAYEVRHAYQGDREVVRLPADMVEQETSVYFAFPTLWPIFLYQLGLLRWAAGFQPTTSSIQSDLYRLEACAEVSLTDYDPFVAKSSLEWLRSFQPPKRDYVQQYFDNCALQYVITGKPGKGRFKGLPQILRMLSSFSEEYREFERHMEGIAKEKHCHVADLRDVEPWPEFEW